MLYQANQNHVMYPPQESLQHKNYASTPGTGPPPSSRLMGSNNHFSHHQQEQFDHHNNLNTNVSQNNNDRGSPTNAATTNGIKLLASPSGVTNGGNTISHRILTTHGASSEVFLKHLQQTWDLHQITDIS